MHSTSLLVAAFAAIAAASPMGSSAYSSANTAYPTTTGGYSMTTSYVETGYSTASEKGSSTVSEKGYPTAIGNPTASPNPTPTDGVIAKLLTEANTVSRFMDIQKEIEAGDLSLKFDFNPAANPGATVGLGGQVDLAQRANFPILTGLGISAAGIFFNPCGLNTPHIHPRATEFLTLVTDTKMLSGFVLENGFTTELNTTLTQFQGTVFPQGSIHFQQNLDCKPAVAIAGLNSEDPGASSVAQNFLVNIDPEIVDATLGFPKQIDADNFAQFKENIPVSLAKGVEECLIRCNIPY
ncbi:uncharacterized protein Z518_04194 [Rhinocladiella mackenziei CBS 650.93]|uniref:Cupin type-1 domain-containing protein n=1 Tax=Rhinocladiella mackenziei CBS 650.93 TaxID=1442369 RepID=A0A0D2IKH7_9EURO|nr:uncharacterized protein Z518_04194 [Rhinocladiella mackenziei CBS 650.93]KIX06219.1 hypothetical protein Z518_04194 [Rhinocladiella mackenziei CBS 650.93]